MNQTSIRYPPTYGTHQFRTMPGSLLYDNPQQYNYKEFGPQGTYGMGKLTKVDAQKILNTGPLLRQNAYSTRAYKVPHPAVLDMEDARRMPRGGMVLRVVGTGGVNENELEYNPAPDGMEWAPTPKPFIPGPGRYGPNQSSSSMTTLNDPSSSPASFMQVEQTERDRALDQEAANIMQQIYIPQDPETLSTSTVRPLTQDPETASTSTVRPSTQDPETASTSTRRASTTSFHTASSPQSSSPPFASLAEPYIDERMGRMRSGYENIAPVEASSEDDKKSKLYKKRYIGANPYFVEDPEGIPYQYYMGDRAISASEFERKQARYNKLNQIGAKGILSDSSSQ